MSILPLFSVLVIFFFVAFVKPYLKKYVPFNLCAICISVSLTWIVLVMLWQFGYIVDVTPIAVLMGMSIVGIMYKLEALYKKNHLKHLWVTRLIIILGGLYTVIFLLQNRWDIALLIIVASLLIIMTISFLLQGVSHADALKTVGSRDMEKNHIKPLDDCC